MYRKVIEYITDANGKPSMIVFPNLDALINVCGYFVQDGGNLVPMIFWYNENYYSYVLYEKANSKIVTRQFSSDGVYNSKPAKMVLEYTKTTN